MYCFLTDSKQVEQVRLYFFLQAWHLCQGIGEQLFLCSGTLSLFSNSEVPLTASQMTPSYLYKKRNTNYLFPTRKSTLLCHVCRVSPILDSGLTTDGLRLGRSVTRAKQLCSPSRELKRSPKGMEFSFPHDAPNLALQGGNGNPSQLPCDGER